MPSRPVGEPKSLIIPSNSSVRHKRSESGEGKTSPMAVEPTSNLTLMGPPRMLTTVGTGKSSASVTLKFHLVRIWAFASSLSTVKNALEGGARIVRGKFLTSFTFYLPSSAYFFILYPLPALTVVPFSCNEL